MGVCWIGGLPDWGIYRSGIYRIGARQSVEGRGVGSEPRIGSAIVAMAAAIVTIANVVMAAAIVTIVNVVIAVVAEPQQSWS